MTSRIAVLALSFTLALPAAAAGPKAKARCPEGQVDLRGQCVAACPAGGPFAGSDACECPPGQGKVLLGSGGAECKRLVCGPGVVDPALCDCPHGTRSKPAGKGKGTCAASRAASKTEAPPRR
jgi:hypothetical protein